jgi:hypothetical protein
LTATGTRPEVRVDCLVDSANEYTYPPEVLDQPVVTAPRIDPRKL